jgi:hypothetical protein
MTGDDYGLRSVFASLRRDKVERIPIVRRYRRPLSFTDASVADMRCALLHPFDITWDSALSEKVLKARKGKKLGEWPENESPCPFVFILIFALICAWKDEGKD